MLFIKQILVSNSFLDNASARFGLPLAAASLAKLSLRAIGTCESLSAETQNGLKMNSQKNLYI